MRSTIRCPGRSKARCRPRSPEDPCRVAAVGGGRRARVGGDAHTVGAVARRHVAPAAAPLRLSADAGHGCFVGVLNLQFGDSTILSPDGTVVAFVGRRATGEIRSSTFGDSTAEATALGGTDDASSFLSPDGGWIGFFAGKS